MLIMHSLYLSPQLPTCTVRPVLRGAAAGRSVMARAADADGNGSPSMSGPISVNPSLVADAVGAGSSSKEAKQPVDRRYRDMTVHSIRLAAIANFFA